MSIGMDKTPNAHKKLGYKKLIAARYRFSIPTPNGKPISRHLSPPAVESPGKGQKDAVLKKKA
jgi:hypothetical protein